MKGVYKMKKINKTLSMLTIGLLSLNIVGCSNGAGTAKDGNELKIEQASIILHQAVEKGQYKLVGTEELKKWIDEKKDMVVVDTMPASNYEKAKIPTAVNAELPVKMSDVKLEQKEKFLKLLGDDKEKTIVIYCGFVGCARSDVGAVIAKEAGYKNVYRQPGGIVAWQDAGNK